MGSDDKSRFEAENSLADELYNIGGRIMLAAIAVLFMVVLFILGLHIYARFIWPRYSGRNRRRIRSSRRRRLAFAENEDPFRQRDGLELSVIEAFPVFVYRTETHKDEIFECAVCLCEFGDNEKGRLLPKCNHSFHIECIDMWFGSNSTCPLCRSDARPDPPVESQECPVLIGEIENPAGEEHGPAVSVTGSSSSVTESNINGCSVLRPDSNFVEESSSPKFVGSVVVEIEPRRLDEISSPRSFMADDQQSVSSGVDSSLKSPASRLQSLRRKILGMSVLQSPDGSSHIEQGGPAKV